MNGWAWLVLVMIAACTVLWLSWTRWSSWDQDYRDATHRDAALQGDGGLDEEGRS